MITSPSCSVFLSFICSSNWASRLHLLTAFLPFSSVFRTLQEAIKKKTTRRRKTVEGAWAKEGVKNNLFTDPLTPTVFSPRCRLPQLKQQGHCIRKLSKPFSQELFDAQLTLKALWATQLTWLIQALHANVCVLWFKDIPREKNKCPSLFMNSSRITVKALCPSCHVIPENVLWALRASPLSLFIKL